MIWHKQLEQRFGSLPAHQQIIMVANELNRSRKQQDNPGEYRNCLERALELMDFIIDDRSKWGGKYRELLRSRYFLAQLYLNADHYVDTAVFQRTLIQMNPTASRLLIS